MSARDNPFGICNEMDTRVEFGRCGSGRKNRKRPTTAAMRRRVRCIHAAPCCTGNDPSRKNKGGLRHPLDSVACTTGDYFFASSSTSCRKFFFHRFLIRRRDRQKYERDRADEDEIQTEETHALRVLLHDDLCCLLFESLQHRGRG